MSNNFKLMKVFDCQGMSEEVCDAFFAQTEEVAGNDIYVKWYMTHTSNHEDQKKVDNWLIDNGAEPNETVIIKRWW